MRTPASFRSSWPSLAAALLVACTGSGKHEAAALTDAVDRFRAANSEASRTATVESLTALAFSAAKVCAAQRTCVEASEPTAMARSVKDQGTRKRGDLEAARRAPDA